MNKQHATLYIVRHAESNANVSFNKDKKPPITQFDSDLTPIGKNQAKKLSEKLIHISFAVIFSSHLLRAKRTSEIIAKKRKIPIIIEEDLQELQLGSLQNKSQLEVEKEIANIFDNSGDKTLSTLWEWKLYEDMESKKEAVNRFINIIQEISAQYPNQTILIISHGNIIRSFLVCLGYGSFKELPHESIANTGYVVVETDGKEFSIQETYGVRKKQIK